MKRRAPNCPTFKQTSQTIRFISWSKRTKAIGRKRDKYELKKRCSTKLPNFCEELRSCVNRSTIDIPPTRTIQIFNFPPGTPPPFPIVSLDFNMNNDTMTLEKGYRWNGCSWSPDCCDAMDGCMFHDALYQLLQGRNQFLPGLKYNASPNSDFQKLRKAADKDMRDIMVGNSFKFASLYYFGVHKFGDKAARLCKKLP